MGWFSRKTTFGKSGLLKGFVDCHSHVLPGVDDGARDIAKSRAILSLMEEQGVERLWLTPHIMEDIPNEPEDLKRRFEEFKSAYSGNIELRLAAEHNIDMLFSERLEKDKLLPFNESRILV
ncbi:MAG: capsular biosynthesis protein, partial [Bacteroidales bacterium]|nr:capsular biosynthesis protein [Bacteroidales bacterium]